jgi:hypothetical protein
VLLGRAFVFAGQKGWGVTNPQLFAIILPSLQKSPRTKNQLHTLTARC